MNCDQVPLFGFSRGELKPASAGRMAAHVAGCNTCAQRLQVIVALQEYYRKRELGWRRPRWLWSKSCSRMPPRIPPCWPFRSPILWFS